MRSSLQILLLEDDPGDAELVQELLEAEGFVCEITRVQTRAEFVTALEHDEIDLILADYKLPSFDGVAALKLASSARSHVPFIFVSGTIGEELAIEALKMGATDYVLKTGLSRLAPSVRRAMREAEGRAERKKAEEALRRSEAYLVEAQRLSHTGSFGWNVLSGEVYWSDETYRIFEYETMTKPTIQTAIDRCHQDDRMRLKQVLERAAMEKSDFNIEHRLMMPDGSVKHIRTVARPSTDEDPQSWVYVGAVIDITERKRAEREHERLRQLEAELAHMNRLTTMGELTASIAHEINQPLAAIVTQSEAALEFLDRDDPDLDEARDSLLSITEDGMRAGEVIRGLRALAGKSGPQLTKLEIDDVIKQVLALTRSELLRHDVVLRTDLDAADRPVMGDRVQLQQVLLNLIMNGVEAMRAVTERTRELTVSSMLAEPGAVLVSIKDTGTGLDPSVAERVFQPFFTTKSNGLGMGLSICRSIVETHGGRLWVSPRTSHGADVRFTVPLWSEQ
jgi:signal transduction histidine kinase/FixJ family two-component response regulator